MRLLKALFVVAVLGAAVSPARASAGWWSDFYNWFSGTGDTYASDADPSRAIADFNSFMAPAAETLIGLGLGAAGIAYARRRSRKQA